MFLTIKKKNITLVAVILLFAVSAVLNSGIFSRNEDVPVSVATDNTDSEEPRSSEAVMVSGQNNSISDAKISRDIVRSKACDLLSKTISDPNVSQKTKDEAEKNLLKIAENMDNEGRCESLLGTKGYPDSVVLISDNNVNVTVAKKELSDADVAKIKDTIFQVTKINNVKIVLDN